MKPSELSRELESAKRRATAVRGGGAMVIAFISFGQMFTQIRKQYLPDLNPFAIFIPVFGVIFAIIVWQAIRARNAVIRSQTLALAGDYVDAARLLMDRLHFPSQKVSEALAGILVAWADERIKAKAWSDAKCILVAVRQNLSRGIDNVSIMIDEARCLAALGEHQEAKALLIVAQSQTRDAHLQSRAERELEFLVKGAP